MKTISVTVFRFVCIMILLLTAACSSSDDNDPPPASSASQADSLPDCACEGEPEIVSDGLVFTYERQTVEKPSNISVLFKMETEEGAPVTGLTSGDFRIYENDESISEYESRQAILPKPGSFTNYTLLLLDLSGSVLAGESLETLKTAARGFVTSVMPDAESGNAGEIVMAIQWFDGAADLHPLVSFTENREALYEGIDGLNADISQDRSTNLYGAVIRGLDILKSQVGSAGTSVEVGSLVIFTDGRDQAARETETSALDAVENSGEAVSTYAIGLGSEIDEQVLKSLGENGFVRADDLEDLLESFESVADTIKADVNSHYLFEYCSPKRKGMHELKIVAERGESTGSLTTCFCADGFEGGCEVGNSI